MRRAWRFLKDRSAPLWPAGFVAVGLVMAFSPLRSSFFDGAPYVQAAILVAVAMVSAALTPRSWSAAFELLLGLALGTAALLVVLADPPNPVGVPGDPDPIEAWIHVANGVRNLLAAPVPVDTSAELLALPLALAWASAYVTVMVMRATRSAIASGLPLVAMTVTMLLLGPGPYSTTAGAGVALALIAHIAARASWVGHAANPGQQVPTVVGGSPMWPFALRSFAIVGAPAILVAGLVGVPLATVIGRDPVRTDLHEPAGISLVQELTPLSGLASQLLDEEATQLFTIQFEGTDGLEAAELDRLRTATLERYDGALWTSGGVFLPVVERVREPDVAGRPTQAFSAEVRLGADYPSSYLPVAGLLRTVSGQALGLDEGSDTLVSAIEVGTPSTISFTAVVPTGPRPTEFPTTPPPGGEYLSLGDVDLPPEFERFAAEAAAGLTDPAERLVAMEAAMIDEDRFGYSVSRAYSGHSVSVLANYLGPEPREGFVVARQGYAEQAAATLAVLARLEGLPARVAVGYLLSDPQAAIEGELVSVTTADAHAWTEIYLGDEWVTFDPTNRTERDAEEIPVPELDESVLAQPDLDAPIVAPRIQSEPIDEGVTGTQPWRLGLVGLLVAALLSPVVYKWLRRRWRRRGSPAARLAGAGRELRDQLRDRGIPATQSMTARDLTLGLGPTVSDEARAEYNQFSELLDRGLFAPHEPDPQVASQAWRSVGRLARGLSADRPRWRRLMAPLNPTSLRRPRPGSAAGRHHAAPEPIAGAEADSILVAATVSGEVNGESGLDTGGGGDPPSGLGRSGGGE